MVLLLLVFVGVFLYLDERLDFCSLFFKDKERREQV